MEAFAVSVNVTGVELLKAALEPLGRGCKAILNESGIAFLPISVEHRSVKFGSLSYEDDYRGNALAAMIFSDHLEIRFHKDFSDERVQSLCLKLSRCSELGVLRGLPIFYQGRRLAN